MADWAESHEDLDEAIRRSPWAKALLVSPTLMDPSSGQVKRELLTFLVAVSLLNRLKEAERPRLTQLQETIRTDGLDGLHGGEGEGGVAGRSFPASETPAGPVLTDSVISTVVCTLESLTVRALVSVVTNTPGV